MTFWLPSRCAWIRSESVPGSASSRAKSVKLCLPGNCEKADGVEDIHQDWALALPHGGVFAGCEDGDDG